MIASRRLLMMAPFGITLAGGAVFYDMLQGEEPAASIRAVCRAH